VCSSNEVSIVSASCTPDLEIAVCDRELDLVKSFFHILLLDTHLLQGLGQPAR
jgi:hypothetical protein